MNNFSVFVTIAFVIAGGLLGCLWMEVLDFSQVISESELSTPRAFGRHAELNVLDGERNTAAEWKPSPGKQTGDAEVALEAALKSLKQCTQQQNGSGGLMGLSAQLSDAAAALAMAQSALWSLGAKRDIVISSNCQQFASKQSYFGNLCEYTVAILSKLSNTCAFCAVVFCAVILYLDEFLSTYYPLQARRSEVRPKLTERRACLECRFDMLRLLPSTGE